MWQNVQYKNKHVLRSESGHSNIEMQGGQVLS